MTKQTEPLLLRPTEAGEILGVGRSTVYTLIKDGVLPAVRVGKKSLRIPAKYLHKWVADQVAEQRGLGEVADRPSQPEPRSVETVNPRNAGVQSERPAPGGDQAAGHFGGRCYEET